MGSIKVGIYRPQYGWVVDIWASSQAEADWLRAQGEAGIQKCWGCQGSAFETCPDCDGAGQDADCKECYPNGEIECRICGFQGYLSRYKVAMRIEQQQMQAWREGQGKRAGGTLKGLPLFDKDG